MNAHLNNTVGKLLLGRLLGTLVVITMLTLAGSARAYLIGFETGEGFPLQDNTAIQFTGSATPSGIVTSWDNTSGNAPWRTVLMTTVTNWDVSIPGGLSGPVEGSQFAVSGFDANGPVSGTMVLAGNPAANVLSSFYWAFRGNGDTRAGGGASFVLEYFDTNNVSLGTEQFFGGRNETLESMWSLAVPVLAREVPLSKVTFTGTGDPSTAGGTFFLDAITVVPEPTTSALVLAVCVPFLLRLRRRDNAGS